MKKIVLLLILLMATSGLFAQTKPTDTDGDGYYNISTLDHLRWVSENDSSWTWDFELDNDINAGETRFWNVGDHDGDTLTADSAMGWSPIGNTITKFTGNFDGKDYAIDSLYINRPITDNIGFFGYRTDNNTHHIKNLTISNGDITGDDYVGALIGQNGEGTVINCTSSGKVTAKDDYAGGLIGWDGAGKISTSSSSCFVSGDATIGGFIARTNGTDLDSCFSSGTVSGRTEIGGFVGYKDYGTADNCSSSASASATGNKVGGFAGYNTYGTILKSYATGSVSGEADYVGGFIGWASNGTFKYCYSTGDVSSDDDYAGGFIGQNDHTTVENCYSISDVEGDNYVGGFTGTNKYAGVSYCYSIGYVSAVGTYKGGFAGGHTNSTVTDCFWDMTSSSLATSYSGTGKNTSEMNSQSTFTNWDFDSTWAIASQKNDGYPYLQVFVLQSPNLISPDDSSTFSIDSNLVLDWKDVLYTNKYHLKASTKSDFSSDIVINKTNLDSSQYTINASTFAAWKLMGKDTIYWKVRAIGSSDTSDWSDTRVFYLESTSSKLLTTKQYMHGLWNGTTHEPTPILCELRTGTDLITSNLTDCLPAIIDSTGEAKFDFADVSDGDYWLVLRAGSYLPLGSTSKIALSSTKASYDFTTTYSKAAGGDKALYYDGTDYMMRGGDFNNDSRSSATDVPILSTSYGKSLKSYVPNAENTIYSDTSSTSKEVAVQLYMHGLWDGTKHAKVPLSCEIRTGTDLLSSTLVKRVGGVIDTTGIATFDFGDAADGTYWIVVRAAGYLPLGATGTITLSTTKTSYDFTLGLGAAAGGDKALYYDGTDYLMRGGDFNNDNRSSATDIPVMSTSYGKSLKSYVPAQ